MDRVPVSAIVMTKNEEVNIRDCILSLAGIDEIFVVDSGSTDGTCAIAEELGATVVQFVWDGRYPKKKQWSLERLPFRNDWVIYVDADERATSELIEEIAHVLQRPQGRRAFWVALEYVFLGKALRHGLAARKVVLLQTEHARFPVYDDLDVAHMWEVEGHYQAEVDGPVGALRARLLHDDREPLYHFFDRHNRYSDWEAELRARDQGAALLAEHTTRPRAKRVFERLPFRWFWLFCYAFVFKAGFLDGRAGFHFALAKSFYYWQVEAKSIEIRTRARSHEPD